MGSTHRGFSARLHHVGFTATIKHSERAELPRRLKELIQSLGFTGQAPGGPSRWSTKRSTEWEPLRPTLVVEVAYDHFSNGRFRHGTTFMRWRPDKAPKQCTFEQVRVLGGANLRSLRLSGKSGKQPAGDVEVCDLLNETAHPQTRGWD